MNITRNKILKQSVSETKEMEDQRHYNNKPNVEARFRAKEKELHKLKHEIQKLQSQLTRKENIANSTEFSHTDAANYEDEYDSDCSYASVIICNDSNRAEDPDVHTSGNEEVKDTLERKVNLILTNAFGISPSTSDSTNCSTIVSAAASAINSAVAKAIQSAVTDVNRSMFINSKSTDANDAQQFAVPDAEDFITRRTPVNVSEHSICQCCS